MGNLTQEKFIFKANKVHGCKYKYSQSVYNDSLTPLIITCPEHGDFLQRPVSHLRGYGCSECANVIRFSNLRKNTLETFIEKAKLKHKNKYNYDKVVYVNSWSKVIIKCKIHGDFLQFPDIHLIGSGCAKCAGIFRYDKEEFVIRSNKIHNDKYDYSKYVYVNNRTKGVIICQEHGEFEQVARNHLNGQGCPICRSSKGEILISKILNKNNINFIKEYRIPNLTPKFRYDFYLPDHRVFIEFHGGQHFKPVKYFGGLDGFKRTRERDAIKKAICRELRIPLIEFNYKHLRHMSEDKFEKILLKRISSWLG